MGHRKLYDVSVMVEKLHDDERVSSSEILKLLCTHYGGEYLYRNDSEWWSVWGRLYEKRPFDKVLLERFTYVKERYDRGKVNGVYKGNIGLTPDVCLNKINLILKTIPSFDAMLSGSRVDVVLIGLLQLRKDILSGKFAKGGKETFPKVVEGYFNEMMKAYRREIGGEAFKSITDRVTKGTVHGEEPDIFVLWAAYLHGESYGKSVKMLGWG